MKIPFYWQVNDYACAPACLQMVLGAVGIRVPQKKLMQQTKANPHTGTSRASLRRVLVSYHLRPTVMRHATLQQLQLALQRGAIVVVNYQEPEEGVNHFAVLRAVTDKSVNLLDPWNGPLFTLEKHRFIRLWKNSKLRRKYTGWALLVSPQKNRNKIV
jgi:ABC-type bacteriocin/lantibiotic exporter with double-glycine peptidase domain